MEADPDVMVIGSENGLGKTSILECCSLLLSALTTRQRQWQAQKSEPRAWLVHWPDLLGSVDKRINLEARRTVTKFQFPASLLSFLS